MMDHFFCAPSFTNSGSAETTVAGGLLQNKLTPNLHLVSPSQVRSGGEVEGVNYRVAMDGIATVYTGNIVF